MGVVTNVGYAHAEYFDSIEGVAAAKRELIEALPRDGRGSAQCRRPARAGVPGRAPRPLGYVRLLGMARTCGPRRRNTAPMARAFGPWEWISRRRLAGRHAVMNLLAAIAVARVFGIAPERLREPVRSFAIGKMRGQRSEHNGMVVWNDCYNSNPEAAQSMIDVLRETPAARRIAVLGEMLELGRAAEELHRQVGRYAAEHGSIG